MKVWLSVDEEHAMRERALERAMTAAVSRRDFGAWVVGGAAAGFGLSQAASAGVRELEDAIGKTSPRSEPSVVQG